MSRRTETRLLKGCGATAQRRAVPAAKRQVRPLRGMQASLIRSPASAPLPDPATRVPRATLRGARMTQAADNVTTKLDADLSEAAV